MIQEGRNIWVTTDLGGSDPDDYQSMIHLLHYADKINIKGITCGHPRGKLSELKKVFKKYNQDRKKYNWENHPKGKDIPKFQGKSSAGDWTNRNGVPALVDESHKPEYSPTNPLIILTWGACTDLAAALHNGLKAKNCFAYCIAGFHHTDWNRIQDEQSFQRVVSANKLKRIFCGSTLRGMYYGWDLNKNKKYVRDNILPYGAMGDYFFNVSQHINTGTHSIKMGDTPSVLWALTSKELCPEEPSWGGYFIPAGQNMWGVVQGKAIGPWPGAATIKRRRFLKHWKKTIRRLYL